MSLVPSEEPECAEIRTPAIDVVIEARAKDLGGFAVRRALPSMTRRQIGPFVFIDEMGPVTFEPGHGMDVRPHPHVALATITYLFEGAIMHRDNLGSAQLIVPGDVNLMVAGRGIAHSERTPPGARAKGGRLHGLQTWVALLTRDEDVARRFEHHPGDTLPRVERPGAELRILAGTAYGAKAPTGVLSPTLYVHARLDGGAELEIDGEHEERGIYVVDGSLECDGRTVEAGSMIVLHPKACAVVSTKSGANAVLVGGAPLDGPRHLWWNFVASSKERIERAKEDWREGRFPPVVGDEDEFIPLPEG